jgi:hypothetical protein
MRVPYTKSGKCGNMVWQRNRYGAYCYLAFVPFNPRTSTQMAVRGNFGAVSARWREFSEEQRKIWCQVARTKWSKPRLHQKGRLSGILLFMKINVALANRGKVQVDLPPGTAKFPQPAVTSLINIGRFDQPPVGPVMFLRANQLINGWQTTPQESLAAQPP